MYRIAFDGTWSGWKEVARAAVNQHRPPEEIEWAETQDAQFGLSLDENREPPSTSEPEAVASAFRVPKRFLELAPLASAHRGSRRWPLLYRVLWRLTHGEPHLLEVSFDPDVIALNAMVKAVSHDLHKMRAFVRFREMTSDTGPWYVAWFEPQHLIVELNAPFFRDRFAAMKWSILTPDRCVHWDGAQLQFSVGVDRAAAPSSDAAEELWRTYYRSIFNPARLKTATMRSQMPAHYWKNLPEAALIPSLIAEAPRRVDHMVAASEAKRPREERLAPAVIPAFADVEQLRLAATRCRACPLWQDATCTVFGEGPPRAKIMLVGEQPGDQEDRAGKVFVGPAGQLLNRAFQAAGIDRSSLYITNAVKHFKWTPRGKRRLHQKPSAREIAACRPWLEAEIAAVQPERIVCLGATATASVFGESLHVTEERGRWRKTPFEVQGLITVHPSSLLRLREDQNPDAEFARFVSDLRLILP
jgi:DNA polymerase